MTSLDIQEASIPIINISSPSPEVAQQVLDAAAAHGFLFIENDGVTIPPADIDSMFELSKNYFKDSSEEKSEYAIHTEKAGGINRGWVAMQGESLDPEGTKLGDPKEAFNIAPPNAVNPSLQPLPPTLSSSSELIANFQTSCHTLCKDILALLGQALQISEKDYFATRHDQSKGASGSIFRLLYYPATDPSPPTSQSSSPPSPTANGEQDNKRILAGAHSDYGTLTLLFRLPGQPGLEILPSSSTTWQPVPVNPTHLPQPPILVNIGDLLSFWTSGLLKSTVHRVVKENTEERYSMAYFCHPLDDVVLDTVPSKTVADFARKDGGGKELESQRERVGSKEGEVLTAREHLGRRLKVTYGLKE